MTRLAYPLRSMLPSRPNDELGSRLPARPSHFGAHFFVATPGGR